MRPRTSLPSLYDLYQTLISVIAMLGVTRILFEMPWAQAFGCSFLTVLSFWLGQGIVSLLQQRRRRGNGSILD